MSDGSLQNDMAGALKQSPTPRWQARIETPAADHRPSIEAYNAACDAVNNAIQNFVVTAEDGKSQALHEVINAHFAKVSGYRSDEAVLLFDKYMADITEAAVFPVVFKNHERVINLDNLASFLGLEKIQGAGYPPFEELAKTIQSSAKTAYDTAMAKSKDIDIIPY